MNKGAIVVLLALICMAAPAMAGPPAPFAISGYTTDLGDQQVNNPDVTVTNINTGEEWTAETNETSNYYRLVLDSDDVNAGDSFRIIAVNDSSTGYHIINVTTRDVTATEMNDGGISDLNLTLDEFYLNLVDFPMHQANASACPDTGDKEHKMCGPATGQMNLNYMWWNSSAESEPPLKYNQSYLYDYGIAHNWNTSLPYFDTYGMWRTIQYLDPSPYSVYGYNFNKYSSTDLDTMMKAICHWICYTVGSVGGHREGYPYHVPGAVPAYGDYSNWMSIRGVHTNKNAAPSTWVTPNDLLVYGFWVNDPYPASLGGIGENSYKTAEEWNETYYKPLNVPGDPYDGKYVGILEPPDEDIGELRIVPAKPMFTDAITPVTVETPLMVYGIEQMAIERVTKDDESLKIVAAAIDGANEQLVPYDPAFAAAFAKTTAGEPMLVASEAGDYYVVPFNVPVELKPIKKVPVEIEKVKRIDLIPLERVKRVDKRVIIKPIPIEPIKIERTLVVVVVDADDGSFKEASWVGDPVKYLPVSKIEALKLALGEMRIMSASRLRSDLRQKPAIELVYRDASPYYPDWKITVNNQVFYVGQDGTVSS